MTLPTPDGLQVALTATTLVAIWITWAKFIGPRIKRKWDRLVGIFQTIAGRDPIIDKRTNKVISPAVPHLGEQLSTLNDTVSKLVAVIESNQDAHHRIDRHDQILADHDSSIAALIASTFERGATAALVAVEKANSDAIDEPTD
jgi:hypothetical protein